MRLLLAVIGACLALSGCDKNQGQVQTQAEKELETWKALCTMEKANGEKLQSALNAERAANVDWPKKFQSAQDQADQLKAQLLAERAAAAREIARLKNELAGAKSAAAASAEQASPSGKSATGGKAAPASATAGQIASAENAVADLQTRLAELQGKAGLARTKVSNLQKATVDTRVPPPDGHVEDATHHATLKEGNFRTELQKQEAVRKAKEELMPIEVELRKVQDDLAKAKLSLGKLRATQETK